CRFQDSTVDQERTPAGTRAGPAACRPPVLAPTPSQFGSSCANQFAPRCGSLSAPGSPGTPGTVGIFEIAKPRTSDVIASWPAVAGGLRGTSTPLPGAGSPRG